MPRALPRTTLAPWIIRVRRYRSPRLLIPNSREFRPLDLCLGTNLSQAANWRPFLKQIRSPTAATRAVAVIGPMPSLRAQGFMEKSIGQRRRSIVEVCFQMKMDADHFNEANPDKEPIQPVLDFTDDVAEREALVEGDESAA